MTGAVSFHSGLSAEQSVARRYLQQGFEIVAHRWRGSGGEIDLIAKKNGQFVFVEVKKSKSHDRAAAMLAGPQISRLFDAAGQFLANCPDGLDSTTQFDVALVDGEGRIKIIENALCA